MQWPFSGNNSTFCINVFSSFWITYYIYVTAKVRAFRIQLKRDSFFLKWDAKWIDPSHKLNCTASTTETISFFWYAYTTIVSTFANIFVNIVGCSELLFCCRALSTGMHLFCFSTGCSYSGRSNRCARGYWTCTTPQLPKQWSIFNNAGILIDPFTF